MVGVAQAPPRSGGLHILQGHWRHHRRGKNTYLLFTGEEVGVRAGERGRARTSSIG